MAKKKNPPVKKLTDTFVTVTGEKMTRRQLSNMVSQLNYRMKKAREYVSAKEYTMLKERFEQDIAALGLYEEGTGLLSLKGITDPKQLRAIESMTRRIRGSHFLTKKRYQEIEKKRRETFKERGLAKDDQEYDMLMKFFDSSAWDTLKNSTFVDKYDIMQILRDDVFSMGDVDDSVFEDINNLVAEYADRYANPDDPDAVYAAFDDEIVTEEFRDDLIELLKG